MERTFIIDLDDNFGKNITRLKNLKSTISIEHSGEYHNCPGYYQTTIKSTLTQEQLEYILYKGNYDYVGVVEKTTPDYCNTATCNEKCMFKSRCDTLDSED